MIIYQFAQIHDEPFPNGVRSGSSETSQKKASLRRKARESGENKLNEHRFDFFGHDSHTFADFLDRNRHEGQARAGRIRLIAVKKTGGEESHVSFDRAAHQHEAVDRFWQRQPDEHAARGMRPGDADVFGHIFFERFEHGVTLYFVEIANLRQMVNENAA